MNYYLQNYFLILYYYYYYLNKMIYLITVYSDYCDYDYTDDDDDDYDANWNDNALNFCDYYLLYVLWMDLCHIF
jgi:hypothetical protein